jgi:hypothetical protein
LDAKVQKVRDDIFFSESGETLLGRTKNRLTNLLSFPDSVGEDVSGRDFGEIRIL